MRSLTVFCALVLAVGCGPTVGTQVPSFESVDQVVARLRQEPPPSALANSLRLTSCGDTQMPCSDTDITMRVVHPHLDGSAETAALEIDNRQVGDLVVFVRSGNGQWTWADSLPLAFRYEPLKLEYRSLVKAPVEEIIVHNNTDVAGSGIYLGHFLIVKLIRGRLQVVFAATAKEVAAPAGGTASDVVSRFQLEPSRPDTPGLRHPATITQTADYTLGRQSHRVVRTFTWDEKLAVFVPAMGDTIR